MISVVLPVRDGLPWLDKQLAALAAQQCEEPWEVVVADNGSTDASKALAHSWEERCGAIRVVDASERIGPSAARNAGIRSARGELLAFCDADDVVQAGWLRACVDALGDADVVAGAFDLWSLNGDADDADRVGRVGPDDGTGPAATSQLGFLPAGLAANLAARRQAVEAVGGFDESLFVGEDIDLCWRLQLEGFRFAIAPAAVVAKRERPGLGPLFGRAVAYGRCGPKLYRRYRARGAHRDVAGAARSWAWLVVSLPKLGRRHVRRMWVRAVGVRLGRLVGSVSEGAFFP
ncbi:MAG TPA: glycosyltransferase [Acidimicrobiales bacterium]|jgi:GT2 family glycosyltransferase